MDAAHVLQQLKEGNARFARGEGRLNYSAEEREAVADEPNPMAVIVGCADSRVPVEAIFDVDMGDVWAVRTAGHVLSEAGLASVRFGAQAWEIPLIVVVGHEGCQAVKAAMVPESPEWLKPITDYIDATPVEQPPAPHDPELTAAVDTHVKASVAALRTYMRTLPLAGVQPVVVGGTYQLTSGEIRWLEE